MGNTVDYRYENLNPYEFQDLVNDLLSREMNVEFKAYSEGKDNGVDLRYSTVNNQNEKVVQIKHYSKNLTLSDVKSELKKVKELNPNEYIIVCSSNISVKSEDAIVKHFKPYIKSSKNIYSRKNLNDLMNKNENQDLEIKYYRLWLTSSNVASNFFNNAIRRTSDYYLTKIKNYLSFIVIHDDWEKAYHKLRKNNFIVITGSPGVGKTILSFWLISKLLDEFGKKSVFNYVDGSIKSGHDVKNIDKVKPEFFLIDDVFGETTLELSNASTSTSSIVNLINEAIETKKKNKFVVITCRTLIFKDAENKSRKLRDENLLEWSNYDVSKDGFNKLFKAKILLQHIYKSNIEFEYKKEILEDENFLKIINHHGYNPRLIQYVTDKDFVKKHFKLNNSYLEFVFKNLSNPYEIWKNSFENEQLTEDYRIIVYAMFSLGYRVKEQELKKIYQNLLKRFKIIQTQNNFKNGIRVLTDTFIYGINENDITYYEFQERSIMDFLHFYIDEFDGVKDAIFASSIYIEQIENRFLPKETRYLKINDIESYFLHFVDIHEKLISIYDKDLIIAKISICIMLFKNAKKCNELIEQLLSGFELEQLRDFYTFRQIALNIDINPIKNYVIENWEEINNYWFPNIDDENEIRDIVDLYKKYNVDLKKLYNDKRNKQYLEDELIHHLTSSIEFFFNDSSIDLLSNNTDWIDEDGMHEWRVNEIIQEEINNRISDFIYNAKLDDLYIDYDNFWDVGNNFDTEIEKMAKVLIDKWEKEQRYWEDYYRDKPEISKTYNSEVDEIKSMFNKLKDKSINP